MKSNFHIAFGLFILAYSCTAPSKQKLILNEYAKHADSVQQTNNIRSRLFFFDRQSYIAQVEFNSSQEVNKINGQLVGREYGHFFDFTSPGELDEYKFKLGDGLHHSYEIIFSEVSRKYIEKGSSLVDCFKNESLSESLATKYTFLFSAFPRRRLRISYSFGDNIYKDLSLRESKTMPFLYEGDVLIDSSKYSKVYFEISASQFVFDLNGLPPSIKVNDSLVIRR
jgi:hypothetical protein